MDRATTGAKGPDELLLQLAETGEEVGEAVQELAAKADVKGRATTRAADLRDKAGAMTVQLRTTAVQAGRTVQNGAARAGDAVQHNPHVPEPVRNAVRAGRGNPRPVLIAGVAGAALVTAVVLGRRARD
ncbi:DUF3618 domain-containing protein [Streptomyces sp. NPDC090306]|uniref:DUF3618 domain-containing protein n=1 Tax=unclassified Streptomyces TaxID=2593676 RepID=UPI0036E29B66